MRVIFDEKVQVRWLTTNPADPAAPTAAEVAAGVNITPFVAKDGLKFGVSNNKVDGGDLSTKFDAESMGTWGSQMSLIIFRDDTTDTAYALFPRGETGCLVILPFAGPATAPAAAMDAYVLAGLECGQPIPNDSAKNERQKSTIEFAVSEEPQFDAVVAA